MSAFLSAPAIDDNALASEQNYLALDLEMSGLDPDKDCIVSVGMVPIRNRQIIMQQAAHYYVSAESANLDDSAAIHNIRHVELELEGIALEAAMGHVLNALQNHVLVLHHKPLDHAFLNRACQQLYGVDLLTPIIDTLALERKRHRYRDTAPKEFRLQACRNRYSLPAYLAHNAASDALATAELWLAQLDTADDERTTKLKRFL